MGEFHESEISLFGLIVAPDAAEDFQRIGGLGVGVFGGGFPGTFRSLGSVRDLGFGLLSEK